MKKLTGISLLMLAFVMCKAQVMNPKAKWITIKSLNMRCWVCKERLEHYFISENQSTMQNGLLKTEYNLLEGEVKIFYMPNLVTPDLIRAVMNNAGFDADDETAEETMYIRLPKQCKRPSDGGGPTKDKPCHIDPKNN